MNKTLVTVAIISMVSTAAFAVDTKGCLGCHGATFEKAALGKSKIVKDMKAADIVTALKGYKDGSYGGAMKGVMKGQVTALSDADIEAMATQIVGGSETTKAETNTTKTITDTVVETVKVEATKAVTGAVDAAKAAATTTAVDAAAKLVK